MAREHFISESIEDRGLDDIEDRGSGIKSQRIDPFPLPKSSPTGSGRSLGVLVELTPEQAKHDEEFASKVIISRFACPCSALRYKEVRSALRYKPLRSAPPCATNLEIRSALRYKLGGPLRLALQPHRTAPPASNC